MSLPYESKITVNQAAFLAKVKAISGRLGILPEWLMVVMAGETAFTFRPDIRSGNQPDGAVGLIQFTGQTASRLGTTKEKLAAMSNVAQLDYVEAYFKPYAGKMPTIGDVYVVVFAPAYLGKADTAVAYKKPSTAYSGNVSLDVEGKGYITIGDIKKRVNKWIPLTHRTMEQTLQVTKDTLQTNGGLIVLVFVVLTLGSLALWKPNLAARLFSHREINPVHTS